MTVDLCKRPANGVIPNQPLIDDSFDQLDHAMAGVRLLSRAITEATERGDNRAVRGLCDLREQLSDEVTRLLRETATMLPEDCR